MSTRVNDAALVIIDVQNDYCDDAGGLAASGTLPFYKTDLVREMVPTLKRLVDTARTLTVPVMWVRTEYGLWTTSKNWLRRGEGRELHICEPGSWGAEWYGGLVPLPDEYVVTKHRYSPFVDTPFETVLRVQGIKQLFITGVTTSVCVESTARDAFMRDYGVVVVSDCTASYDLVTHEASLQNARRHFGTVMTSREVAEAMGAARSNA